MKITAAGRINSAFALTIFLSPIGSHALAPGDNVTVDFKDNSSVEGGLIALSGSQVTLNIAGSPVSWNMEMVRQVEAGGQPSMASATSPQSAAQSQPDGLAPLPPMGFNTPPPGQINTGAAASVATDPNVVAVPVVQQRHEFSEKERAEFLKNQADEREQRRHENTSPLSDFQFNLQQAIDREERGIPTGATAQDPK